MLLLSLILLPVAPLYRWGDHTFNILRQIADVYYSDGLFDIKIDFRQIAFL